LRGGGDKPSFHILVTGAKQFTAGEMAAAISTFGLLSLFSTMLGLIVKRLVIFEPKRKLLKSARRFREGIFH
jgi:hypothetical protein